MIFVRNISHQWKSRRFKISLSKRKMMKRLQRPKISIRKSLNIIPRLRRKQEMILTSWWISIEIWRNLRSNNKSSLTIQNRERVSSLKCPIWSIRITPSNRIICQKHQRNEVEILPSVKVRNKLSLAKIRGITKK